MQADLQEASYHTNGAYLGSNKAMAHMCLIILSFLWAI